MSRLKIFKFDLCMIFMLLVTLNIWYNKDYIFLYGLSIYLIIFAYLIIKHKPISYFIIVILFSVMSMQKDTEIFKIDYILILILFIYVVIKNIKNKYIVFGNLFFALLIYLLYNLLSISWTPIKLDGFNGLVAMLEGYIIYYIATNGKFIISKNNLNNISKIATYLMLTLSIEILYNYCHYGFESVINSKSLVELGWGYSNLIAVIYVLLLPIALYKYLDKKQYFIQFFLIDLLNVIGLILTLSRGAIIGFLASLLLFIIFYIRKNFIIKYGSIIGLIIFIIYRSHNLYYYFLLTKDRFFSKDFFDDSNRFPLYELGLETFKNKMVFGNGLKSSKYLIYHYLNGRNNVHFHNFILQIAVTLGIVGLLLFIYIVYKWIKVLYKPYDSFVTIVAFSIIGALTHQMVDVSFDLFFFGVYFYVLISIVEIYRHGLKEDKLKLKILEK